LTRTAPAYFFDEIFLAVFWWPWRMFDSQVQDITATDAAPATTLGKTLLALNNAHAQELSWLEPERLQHLVGQAFLARRIGNLDAFLLAFDQDADYDSPNFLWFRARYPRFVYVDRIVVASPARGRGCARRLYDELFAHAGRAGHKRIVCEVNKSPPNPASDALHAALGFVEVGSADVHGGLKTVRYLSRMLDQAAVAGGRASTE
jgi:predicted GNAT superfamily acetyltransferase